jgi:replicative superfamily II helicase
MKKVNLNYLMRMKFAALLLLCLLILFGCTSEQQAEQQNEEKSIVEEVIKTNKNMYYKFYKSKSAGLLQKEQMVEFINAFDKIYAENDVDVVGTWYNVDDPSETYFMTAFKSEQHYTDFIEKMKTHEDYQRMSMEMEPDRLSIEAATLISYTNN